ncbi:MULTISPECIES: MurR/RpiR family transcriptional regulator [Pseudoalteromonas]|jgi:DNA-binding MurR/RpiR family transcriptional regulator|uniref:MurR/RpiR family transcriptional regulator n=1 Tax=Pseudoalteromonas TaxID=53246 RepID=UPI0007840175|nr:MULTISPECIES: MurR/RpiR family transcriptional regulator [Gammaproteobacteria]MCF7498414.1 MurR/RpiR family transcriptional regulator [Pseudoalteromonas sp. L1]RZF92899.1 MurR/RpiR family transcriptional regulator [Pseudoalteromonas sp. CO302Y]RZG09734.1 MurR/RpiR family transcriptional regulator [Pseudoalteromonas sp. CO133X]UJX24807.1 MurR/RpiR family transcriptional regulator [Pseudoalteromonas sp. CF6-2]WOC25477.1 MurR/RpiR family transcriptional regulator [Pseudoalteromonas sp. N1230-9|tara:strand:+ start:313 stop:1158 length:846 start_codon:yes stop_codon:yes gene_type:complete
MSTFVKIKALRQSLSSSEAKLADFTLNSANAIRNLSSVELAKVVGVSQSSVVKFSQKLGYKGFPAFKLAVIDALNDESSEPKLHGKITLNDSLEQIAEKLLSSKLAVLTETKNLNEAAAIEKAVELLKSAKRILICGVGGSALVAKDFSYKLQKLGMPAIAEPDGHAQLAYVATFSKGDLVIAISESGMTREIAEVVKQAKKNASSVISVTKFGSSLVADSADVKLYSVAEGESVRLSSILARTAQDFVIDILFIALTQSSRQGRKLLEHSNEVVGEFKNN